MIIHDFDWSLKGVRVKATGAFIPFTWSLVWDIWRGGSYIIAEQFRPRPHPLIDIHMKPAPPRPWYLLWGALRQAGVKQAQNGYTGYFTDDTTSNRSKSEGMNGHCLDISKSRVAATFENVFSRRLSIDPETYPDPFVVKSEINGEHSGRVATEAETAQDGWVYQRLIDNSTDHGTVADLRCPTVFGKIPLIYIKERPLNARFANLNTKVRLVDPKSVLSEEEREQVSRFCQKMGLDWGGLDILRDNATKEIYIVDVNKTDMGPPLALPLKQKLRSTRILGQALRAALQERV